MKHYLWHRFIFSFLRYTAGPVVRRSMGYSCVRQKGPENPSLIIANHNANLDPALVGLAFSRQMYYIASEHSLRNGFSSVLLKFLFDPIAINKTRADISAIKEMIRRLKAGANVCLFAEGDRSFTGVTAPVSPSTAKLAKASGADLVTFRIEGGYFTTPRWAAGKRKGRMYGQFVNRYPAAQLKEMTDKQVLEAIDRDIFEDAYERQKVKPSGYRGKNLAESIEIVLYMCPGCGKIGTIQSKGDRFFCGCGLSGTYTEMGMLEGESLPFTTITQWGRWQESRLGHFIQNAGDGPICQDEGQQLFEVQAAAGKALVGLGAMSIDNRVFHCAGLDFPLEQITRIVVAGQMTLLFGIVGGAEYEVRSALPRSALKYKDIFRVLTGRS